MACNGLQVRNNLHMVFTASPVGANFRVRSQRFLATINSTVIDWFQPWPEASLHRSATITSHTSSDLIQQFAAYALPL